MRLYTAFVVLFLFSALLAHASDDLNARLSLRGLNGVRVIVEDLPSEVEQNGLKASAIQTDVELKLRQVAIPVLEPIFGNPYLDVSVDVLTSDNGLWSYLITVSVLQPTRLVRDPSIGVLQTGTWGLTSFGTVGKLHIGNLRESVKEDVDKFINAYVAVNPIK